ncbi:pseudouridine synthase [Aliidiomarina haloalkalitolerans]|uniref:Pseudouridine synthase n=1 Tax=Aliidiomarina haloalkalitolerans TaxID=859059 RepID=A0A432VYB2_9GAMM|nr:pseudouridine synthase [Aliidiomarina haloalkalitolerans]RUO21681.1 pseudouridine synthase [Aliidiomarina haloalkalitolerans]
MPTSPTRRRPTRTQQTTKRPRPTTVRVVLLNKPMNVLCQFTGNPGEATLADYVPVKDVYPAGRLDKDSEGLVVLTNDGQLQAKISSPKFKQAKIYYVLVEGIPSQSALAQLRAGVELNDGKTLPVAAEIVAEPDWLWPRQPPVRIRQSITDTWIKLTLREGRNRQVRRMTAAIGHPTLRLIRYQVSDWTIEGLLNGEYREINASTAGR